MNPKDSLISIWGKPSGLNYGANQDFAARTSKRLDKEYIHFEERVFGEDQSIGLLGKENH